MDGPCWCWHSVFLSVSLSVALWYCVKKLLYISSNCLTSYNKSVTVILVILNPDSYKKKSPTFIPSTVVQSTGVLNCVFQQTSPLISETVQDCLLPVGLYCFQRVESSGHYYQAYYRSHNAFCQWQKTMTDASMEDDVFAFLAGHETQFQRVLLHRSWWRYNNIATATYCRDVFFSLNFL